MHKNSNLLTYLMLWYISFLPRWSGLEINCTLHVPLPKQHMNCLNLSQIVNQVSRTESSQNLISKVGQFILLSATFMIGHHHLLRLEQG